MKKMPTLFVREFDKKTHGVLRCGPEVTPGCEWVLDGEGIATEKVDGACAAIINGVFYRRYDAKRGRYIPKSAIPCQPEPDPVTGHWPHWLPVAMSGQGNDKWFAEAYANTWWMDGKDGTFEVVGPHFQANPYILDADFLEPHGRIKLHDVPRDYEGIKEYLRTHELEGIVWWRDGVPGCKIKRRDFGFEWPVKRWWDEYID